nr:uncharacterized protein LOC131791573 [Pocillopora verrucosa]
MELVCCGCRGKCETRRCSCVKNELHCTEACSCGEECVNCDNSQFSDDEDDSTSNEEEDDLPLAYGLFGNLLPQQGDKKTDAGSCADILFPIEYNFKPYVDEEVKRQHFSGTELLKKGTTVTASSPNHFQSKPENATSLRTGNLHCSQTEKVTINEESHREDQLPLENFSYAMEGPLATGYLKSTHQQNETCAVFKSNACTDDIEEERKQVTDRLTSTFLTATNLSLGKISEKKVKCLEKDYLSAGTNITCPDNAFERPSARLVNNKSSCSKRKSDVFKDTYLEDGSRQKSLEFSSYGVKNFRSTNLLEHHNRFNIPGKLGFDVGNSSFGGETNASARTRVYHGKTKTKAEIGYTKRDGLAAVQTEQLVNESPCWAAKEPVTDVNLRANLRAGKVRDVYTHFVGVFF